MKREHIIAGLLALFMVVSVVAWYSIHIRQQGTPTVLGNKALVTDQPVASSGRETDTTRGAGVSFPADSVGYIGCSMTVNALEGYQSEGGKVLWGGSIGDFGGGTISAWAGLLPASNKYWTGFDSLFKKHPDSKAVWMELCISVKKGGATNDTYENAVKVREEILKRIPGVTVYVSAQPSYTAGHVCGIAGADGPAKMQEIADKLVANGLAQKGPILGPLSTGQTADPCHANASGKSLMGKQLVAFFDTVTSTNNPTTPSSVRKPPKTPPVQATKTNWPEYFSTSRNTLPVWAKTLRRTSSVDGVKTLLTNSNIILTMGVQVCGALGSGKGQEEVDALKASVSSDGGTTYRNCIKNEAIKGVQAQTNDHIIYWHIGNEINSQHYSGTMGTTGKSSDQSMIPDFVEYFVAPTVQGLDEASNQTGFDTPAVLGSIVSGHNADSRAWLDAILNYTIVGTYAPALAGKHVYEVVDYTSFHYTVAATNWEESFNDISKWIGKGKVKGMIDTEELGSQSMARGAAQFQAIQGFANQMYWVNSRGYTPTQARLNFWAQSDNTPDEAMNIVHTFLGDTPLKNLTNPTLIGKTGSLSTHALATANGDKRLVSVLAPQGVTGSFSAIQFPAEGWSGTVSGTMYVFKTTTGTDKYTSEPITATLSNGVYTLSRNTSLASESAAVILLAR